MENSLASTTDSPPSAGLDIDVFGLLSPYDDSGLDNLLLDYDPPGPQSIGIDLPGDNGALTSLSTPASALLPDKRQGDTPNATEPAEPDVADPGPTKIGNRFTSGAIKILRTWFNAHERHPYPTPSEIERLQRQSGLERQQITNWFANTRRRRKFASTLSPSPHLPDSTDSGSAAIGAQQPVEIPPRPPTPMAFDIMNPLERWEHSPPEHEAALVSDISRAIAASARLSGPSTRARSRSAGWSSGNASSVSSAPTSRSSRGSQSSAYSFGSKRSSGSVDSKKHYPSRRRRRQVPKPQRGRIAFVHERNTYQCTFCTETFKKKYDWQRHEKSLHLSLEKWVCSPDGSTTANAQGDTVCVYCDKVDPDKPHLDGHHQAACIDRPLEERTFYRKDHLKQHLKLVHETTVMTPSTEGWRTGMDAIRSRCGFCGATFETWTDRGNHLAEHFRDGLTILDWEGDWGFDPSVADMLDNAMPPYLVQFEHGSIIPFRPSRGPADTLPSAYELLKLELEYYVRNHFEANETLPSDDDLKYEGCSVIFGSEFTLAADAAAAAAAAVPPVSWLRDLFMSCGDAATRARFRPMGQLVQGRITTLRINGKANIFENCELEAQLCHHYAGGGGATLSDSDLQQAACAVLKRVDSSSPNPSQRFVGFLARLVWESTDWLVSLRQRAEQTLHGDAGSGTLMGFDGSPASGVREELGLLDFYGTMSADQRRWYFSGMKSGTAPEDNSLAFHPGAAEANSTPQTELFQPPEQELPDPRDFFLRLHNPRALHAGPHPSPAGGAGLPRGHGISFSLNDSHRYLRLAGELSRFVASTMSPNNPTSHVPSDDELRHQARWILYDDDDPWNQTPADTEQWLRKFKQDVGLL